MRRWTKEEIRILGANYSKLGVSRCAELLNRPENAVKKRAARARLTKDRRPFTEEELKYIEANYADMGPIAISERLNVRRDSVYGVAQRFGLKMIPAARGKISTRNNTGRKMSDKCKAAIKKANQKHFEPKRCFDCGKEIMRQATRCRECAAKERGGEGHNWYSGGVTPLYGAVFKRLYPVWKFPIMARDNYECQECGQSGTLEVHHIRLFTEIRDKVMNANPHLSIDDDKIELAELIVKEHRMEDGITLCRPCHEKRHFEKRGELLEHPNASGEDNQQPSRLNVISMVNRKVQRLTGKESQTNNPDTSAPHIERNGVMR